MEKSRGPSWSVLQIMSELVEGHDRLAYIAPAVSILGSARLGPEHPYYQQTEELARQLSARGFSVISGGGPGLMEAANRGAQAGGGGQSVGLNIKLPHEQRSNDFQDISLHFRHFCTRKVMFMENACAYVMMPGGFGTLDELFEITTMIQTGKAPAAPIILVGKRFWAGLCQWLATAPLEERTINARELALLQLCDGPAEALELILTACKN